MASELERYNAKIKAWLSEHDALVEKIRSSSEQVVQDMEQGLSTFDSITKAFRSFVGMMSQAANTYTEEINDVGHSHSRIDCDANTPLVPREIQSELGGAPSRYARIS